MFASISFAVACIVMLSRDVGRGVEAYLTTREFDAVMDPAVRSWRAAAPATRVAVAAALAARLADTSHADIRDVGLFFVPSRGRPNDPAAGQHGVLVRQDVFVVGGRAAWALEMLFGGMVLPELSETLDPQTRSRRVATIREVVRQYTDMVSLLHETDYPTLAVGAARWRRLPASARVRVLELLAGQIGSTTEVGLNRNDEVGVPSRFKSQDHLRNWSSVTPHDIHMLGGRAAWLAEQVAGATLPFGVTLAESAAERGAVVNQFRYLFVAAFRAGVTAADGIPKE